MDTGSHSGAGTAVLGSAAVPDRPREVPMYEFLEYTVADAMTYRPLTVGPHDTLAEVEGCFEAHDYDCLPVCDQDGRMVGVVSKLDFLRAFAFSSETMVPRYDDIMQRPVESVMSRHPMVVSPDTPLTRVLQLMVDTRHKSFPVVMGDLVLGMIARRDIVCALRQAAGRAPQRFIERRSDPWTTFASFAR
jgi:CBS domain-containing protein